MQTAIPHFIDHLGNENFAFLFAPAEDLADEAKGVGLDAHGHVFALITADFLHFWVFGPGTYWDLDGMSMGG